MTIIHNTLGQVKDCHIEIWDDMHAERAGFYRAYFVEPGGTTGSPVVGYCSPGGSHRTIRATVAECRRMGYTDPVYRNNRHIA
jgi:hypothetical protein